MVIFYISFLINLAWKNNCILIILKRDLNTDHICWVCCLSLGKISYLGWRNTQVLHPGCNHSKMVYKPEEAVCHSSHYRVSPFGWPYKRRNKFIVFHRICIKCELLIKSDLMFLCMQIFSKRIQFTDSIFHADNSYTTCTPRSLYSLLLTWTFFFCDIVNEVKDFIVHERF